MLGSFNQKSLELFQEAMSESMFSDFSEGDFYDFTTCIRPDGSAYGTSGKCRKGTEGKAKEKEVAQAAQKKLVRDFKTSEIDPVIKSAQELKNRIGKTQKNTPEYEKLQTEFGQARNRIEELKREKLLDPVSGKKKSYSELSMAAGMREPREIGFKLKTPDSPQVKGEKEDLQKQLSVAMRNGDRDRALMLKRSLNELKDPELSGRTRPKAAIESDMRKLTSSGAMQQKGLTGVKARAEHARLKTELNSKDPVAGLRQQERSRQAKQAVEQKAKNLADAKEEMKDISNEIKNRGPHTRKELADLNEKMKYATNRANQIESGKTMTREQFQAGLKKMG